MLTLIRDIKGDKAIFGKLYFNGGFLPPFLVPQAMGPPWLKLLKK